MRTSTPAAPGRPNVVALAMLGCLAAGSGTGLAATLVSCSPQQQLVEIPRPLSSAEAHRLAEMRLINHRDGSAGLSAVVGTADRQIRVTGWVNWHRQIIYASVGGPAAGRDRGLVQAAPRVIATRPAAAAPRATSTPTATAHGTPTRTAAAHGTATRTPRAAAGAGEGPPPDQPPRDGWRVRPLGVSGSRPAPLDSLLALIFASAADRADPVDPLRTGGSRWLGRDRVGDATVDVVLGPAVAATSPPPNGDPAAAATGAATVRYWLDDNSRLHRLEAMLAGQVPVLVDFDRAARPEPVAIPALGGAPVRPRPVTRTESRLLARMHPATRVPDGTTGDGASLAVELPTLAGAQESPGGRETTGGGPAGRVTNLRGAGWITWYGPVAYLAVRELDQTAGPLLLRADRDGVAIRTAPGAGSDLTSGTDDPAGGGATGTGAVALPSGTRVALPPLPPPVDRAWSYRTWQRRGDASGAPDLDLLINEAFAAGTATGRDPDQLRTVASWLRSDTIGRYQVAVFEIRRAAEAGTPAGAGRLRYWVDRSGALHRVELRTRAGVFAQLDIVPAQVPYLPPVPTG